MIYHIKVVKQNKGISINLGSKSSNFIGVNELIHPDHHLGGLCAWGCAVHQQTWLIW